MTHGERLEAAIALQLRVELVERDLTQQDLAKLLGIYPASLSRYVMGHRHIPMRTFMQIARIFDMTPSELLGAAEARVERASVKDVKPAEPGTRGELPVG